LGWAEQASPALKATASARKYAEKIDAAGAAADGGELEIRKNTFKQKPGPVIVLLGKILPDLPRPEDVGFIHEDVKEWFLDCCRTAYENDVNLVIKPHPAEFKSLISLYVNQDFLSFLDELPAHMRPQVVDRFSLPITDLGNVADGVILWGGNSLVELGLLGIPTMVCGKFGALDCPVGFDTSDTRARFVDFLKTGKVTADPARIRENVIAFLSYVTSDAHTIPGHFNNRSMYNSEIWPPMIDVEAIRSDPRLISAAHRIADYIQGHEKAIIPPVS
jgi:hypothetical protein